MREIKFRAYNHLSKQMAYMDQLWSLEMDPKGSGFMIRDPIQGEDTWWANETQLMQYTGLKDKNGMTEVYEGDIIDTEGNVIGNIYAMDKRETDLVLQDFGGKTWCATYKEAVDRGLRHAE